MKLIVIILKLTTIEVIIGDNIAIGKRAAYCDGSDAGQIVTDGIRDKLHAASFPPLCARRAYIDVSLDGFHSIHYVMVFEGANARGQLDYFIVYEFTEDDMVICSYHSDRSTGYLEKGMRVNCELRPPANQIRIESWKNEGMEISEIEVHTLNDYNYDAIFLGCFSTFNGRIVGKMDFLDCRDTCRGTVPVMGIKNNDECFCGTEIEWDALRAPTTCLFLCGKYGNSCGSVDGYSLYLVNLVFPHYLGCDLTSDADILVDNIMSLSECFKICGAYNFAFLTNTAICECSNRIIWKEMMDENHSKCNLPCRDDGTWRCGGYSLSSIYGMCRPMNGRSLTCPNLLNCLTTYDEYGICEGHRCAPNFESMHCHIKIPEVDECIDETICPSKLEVCENIPGSYVCQCVQGFSRSGGSVCEDIDECMNITSCNVNTSECKNSEGSYLCQCHQGFTRSDKINLCEDIDECNFIQCPDGMECVNLEGNFRCDCKTGYSLDTSTDHCEDIDECKSTPCSISLNCKNMEGSFKCQCDEGYSIDSLTGLCEDINECESHETCDSYTSTCVNSIGSYECECKPYHTKTERDLCIKNSTEERFGAFMVVWYFLWFICVILILLGLSLMLCQKGTNKSSSEA